jgi:hypothetical protein
MRIDETKQYSSFWRWCAVTEPSQLLVIVVKKYRSLEGLCQHLLVFYLIKFYIQTGQKESTLWCSGLWHHAIPQVFISVQG